MHVTSIRPAVSIRARRAFCLAALALVCLATAVPAQTTIRIRLIDGKHGKALTPASIRVQTTPAETPRYIIPAADPASVLVYLHLATSFTVSQQFVRCDAAPGAPPAQYTIQDVLDRGIVSANTCGKPSLKPTAPKPGELTLYVRHATPCETTANHVSGINICSSPAAPKP
jgi:hypothetical protein